MKQTKRLLCLVLSLIMLLSLFPTAALAEGELEETGILSNSEENAESNIIDGAENNDENLDDDADEEHETASDILSGDGESQGDSEGENGTDGEENDNELQNEATDEMIEPDIAILRVGDGLNAVENEGEIVGLSETAVIDSGTFGLWDDNLNWTLYEDGELVISGAGEMGYYDDGNVIGSEFAPPWSEYRNDIVKLTITYGVTTIGWHAFWGCRNLTVVSLPESLQSIGFEGFCGCVSLTEINLPESLVTIEGQAFSECSSLLAITIPAHVSNIEDYAFNSCDNLRSITVDAGNTSYSSIDGVLFNKDQTELIRCPAGKNGAYTVPNSVESIGNSAFAQCYRLTSVALPASLTSIGNFAFALCSGLSAFTVDAGNESYSSEGGVLFNKEKTELIAFPAGIRGEYTVPNGVQRINNYAFYACDDLTGISFPESLQSIGDYAFRSCGGLVSILLPDGLTGVGSFAFYYCNNLRSITIPVSLTSIASYTFGSCNALTLVHYGGTEEQKTTLTGNGWDTNGNEAFFNATWNYGIAERTELASGTCGMEGDNLTWALYDDGELVISGTGAMAQFLSGNSPWYSYCNFIRTVTVESGVTTIGNEAFYDCSSLKSIALPDGLTDIGNYAFIFCSNIREIAFPDSLTSIGFEAFGFCENLTSIVIPAGITRVGEWAFYGCKNLVGIYVAAENPYYSSLDGVLFNKAQTALLCCPGSKSGRYQVPDSVTSLGFGAFSGCSELTDILLPTGLTSIGTEAFYSCSSLKGISIPSSVTSIDDLAFAYCGSLASIELPTGMTAISEYTFLECGTLTSVSVPASVTSIGESAFEGCNSLTDVFFSGTEEQRTEREGAGWASDGNDALFNATWHCRTIIASGTCGAEGDNLSWTLYDDGELVVSGEGAMKDFESSYSAPWYGMEISAATINSGVTRIGDSAFFECGNLADITIPDTVTSIGKWVFEYCSSLSSVSIPDTVTSIGPYTFYSCSGLTALTIPSAVTNIESGLFSGCTNLTAMTIPASVTSIGSYAFSGCSSLASITIPATVTLIEEYAFNTCYSLLTVFFDGTAEQKEALIGNGWDPNGNDSLLYANWRFPSQAPEIVASGNCGSNASWSLNSDGTLTVSGSGIMPNYMSPMSIPWRSYLNDITSVVVESGITNICRHAFHWCSNLTSVTLPESLTYIGASAFADCTSLEEIVIPYGVTRLDGGPFINCTALANVTLPDSLTSIESNAFYGCTSLTSITIPDSVTDIGIGVFQNCSNLASFLTKPDSQVYSSQDGVLFNNEMTELVLYPPAKGAVYVVPNSVTQIGKCAFSGVDVTDVTLPDGLLSIGQTAFAYCNALTGIAIPASANSIGDYAFRSCHSLQSAVICSDTTSIGVGAFDDCTTLRDVSYGVSPQAASLLKVGVRMATAANARGRTTSGTASIGELAFDNCSSLTSITIPATVTSIGDAVFGYCTSLTNIYVDAQNPNYCSDNGILFTTDKTRLVAYPAGRSGSFDIPAGVTDIDYAFYGCISLTGVSFPGSLTSIGDKAFYGCSGLTVFTIPAGITSLGTGAFSACSGLTSVSIPFGVTVISDEMFMDCSSLPEITLPETVTSIGSNAFGSCYSLSSVVFEGDAPAIDVMAFFPVTATAWYPLDKAWTVDDMQNYGGTLSWVGYNPTVSENVAGTVAAEDLADGEIEAVTAALRETMNETPYTTIVIELVSQEQESGEEDTLVFEVHPAAVAYDGSTAVGAVEIENEQLSENASFTVILPVDKAWAGKTVAWTHVSEGYPDESGTAPVKGNETDGYYVEVSGITHFSTFALQLKGTVSLTGTALSWNENADVEVLLYAADTEDSALNTAAQSGDYSGALKVGTLGEITASGKQYACAFTVSDVEPGTYKLLVMKPGKYVPVIHTVDLQEDTTLDAITLWLYGDVTADGKVNGTDALQIKRYFADISSIFMTGTDEVKAERMLAANVTVLLSGDNKVNGTDALQIQRYFADISSVFMYMR